MPNEIPGLCWPGPGHSLGKSINWILNEIWQIAKSFPGYFFQTQILKLGGVSSNSTVVIYKTINKW